ncbi:hypothetical protein ACVDG3_15630 [Meridianimarinicoccus sp. RP-17]|uniref:hypothetical protein n=1 Tax=Meridianimarinicoccus zhengii TaxID=2056810 RepID=UPI000DAE80A1|nr:hypothetical protein [Phycocomes zhengii]
MTPSPREDILVQLSKLDDRRLTLLQRIADQILVCNDPDIVETFVAWRNDPRIESVLSLAGSLDDDRLDQLLFVAEDLFGETEQNSPRARA